MIGTRVSIIEIIEQISRLLNIVKEFQITLEECNKNQQQEIKELREGNNSTEISQLKNEILEMNETIKKLRMKIKAPEYCWGKSVIIDLCEKHYSIIKDEDDRKGTVKKIEL